MSSIEHGLTCPYVEAVNKWSTLHKKHKDKIPLRQFQKLRSKLRHLTFGQYWTTLPFFGYKKTKVLFSKGILSGRPLDPYII